MCVCVCVCYVIISFAQKQSVKKQPSGKLISKLSVALKYLPYYPPVPQGVAESRSRKTKTMEKAAAAAEPKHPSDRLFCCRSLRQRIPKTHRDELYHVIRMSGPLVRTVPHA